MRNTPSGVAHKMRRKELESLLSEHVRGFERAKIALEQYWTPPAIAASLMHQCEQALQCFHGKRVLDLGCGTGCVRRTLLACSVMISPANAIMRALQ